MTYLTSAHAKDDSLYPKDIVKRAIVDQRLSFDLGTLYQRMYNYFVSKFDLKKSSKVWNPYYGILWKWMVLTSRQQKHRISGKENWEKVQKVNILESQKILLNESPELFLKESRLNLKKFKFRSLNLKK